MRSQYKSPLYALVLTAVGGIVGCSDNSPPSRLEQTVQAQEQQSGLRVTEGYAPKSERVGMPAVLKESPTQKVEQEARELVQRLYQIGSRTKNKKEDSDYNELFIDIKRRDFRPPIVNPLKEYDIASIEVFDKGKEVVVDGVERIGVSHEGALDIQVTFFLKVSYGQLKIDKMELGGALQPGETLAKSRR